MQVFSLAERAALWTRRRAGGDRRAHVDGASCSARRRAGGVAGLQLLDVATYLPGDLLPKSDIASMAHSLELRSPLLDHRVVELGLSLPIAEAWSAASSRSAARSPTICRRSSQTRGKTGFGVPLAAWFRGELRDARARPAARRRARPRLVRAAARSSGCSTTTRPARADNGHRLWTLVDARALAARARRRAASAPAAA